MPNKLKPCPFCGKYFIRIARLWSLGGFACWCVLCHSSGPVRFKKKEAIEAWNRRA